MSDTYTFTEAAESWVRSDGSTVSRKTFQRERARGKFAASYKAGSAWVISGDDLETAGYVLRDNAVVDVEDAPELGTDLLEATFKLDAISDNLDRVTTEKAQVIAERDRAQSDLEHLSAELERTRVDLAQAQAKADATEKHVIDLRGDIERERSRSDTLDNTVIDLREQVAEARSNARWSYRRMLRKGSPDSSTSSP